VAVAAVSAHREAAFKAANLMMDFLKTDAPFWKREIWKDGSESWVDAKSTDADARESWSEGR
jgi:molybdopterin synthase catalytic subunit